MACLFATPSLAQGLSFNCDVVFYQVRDHSAAGGFGASSAIFKFGKVDSTVTPTALYGSVTQTIQLNGLGYNPVDNYMYGLLAATGVPQLYRVGQSGYQLLGPIANDLPGGIALTGLLPTAGVFDAGGRYYFAFQGAAFGIANSISPPAIFRIDAVPSLPGGTVQVSYQYNLRDSVGGTTTVPNFGDFDFNGAGSPNGLFLAVGSQASYGDIPTMLRLTLDASAASIGTVTAVTTTLALPSGGPLRIGSAFWDAAANAGVGKFYVFDNNASTFYEIVNPEVGSPSASATTVPLPTSPSGYTDGLNIGTSDGTSCPISGTRRAELTVSKTDNKTTVSASSITAYTIKVANDGPYPANYTVVQDPAVPGLRKLSVLCSASTGPPTPVCPATLSTTTFEAGVTVITFPPGTTLTFTVNAQVTDTVNLTITNTVNATVAADTTETNRLNNTAVDVNVTVNPTTRVNSLASICPAGTAERQNNLFVNGDFANASPLNGSYTFATLNTWSGPGAGALPTVARQQDQRVYGAGPAVVQSTFPGDSTRSVASSDFWLLSNGLVTAIPTPAAYDVWTQNVTGLVTGRTYTFMVYMSNATRPTTASTTTPDYGLMVATGGSVFNTISGAQARFTGALSVNETGSDTWTLVQGTFTALATTATLAIRGTSTIAYAVGQGKQTALAQATLRECAPAPDISVTKIANTSTFTSLGTNAYTITVANATAGVMGSNTLITDPGVSNILKTSVTCVATGGAVCPATLSLINLEGAGLLIPSIPGLGTVVFRVFIDVTGPPGATVSNYVEVSSSSYNDANLSNNSALHTATIVGTSLLTITKTNAITTLSAGQTTAYTVTVGLQAGAAVVGAVFKDPVAAGLSCTSITCAATTGVATCPAPAATTVLAMQGAGIVLPSMTAPSTVVFVIECGVTATGR